MTIHRSYGQIEFECNACGEVRESGTDVFQDAWNEAKQAGWWVFKDGNDDWVHRCPTCPRAVPNRRKLALETGIPPPITLTKEKLLNGFNTGKVLVQEEWANPQEIAWVDELIRSGIAKEIEPWTYKDEFQCKRRKVGPARIVATTPGLVTTSR